MPKLLNVDFSSVTSLNSVVSSSIETVDNVTYNNNGLNLALVGNFKGLDTYTGCIVKIFSGGTQDITFDVGIGVLPDESANFPTINTISIDNNGNYYVGGFFSTYKNVSANNIVKILPNGDLDTTFNYGTGFNSEVRKIVIQPDGKIVVCGLFSSYNGNNVLGGLIRLNSDGTIDNSFLIPNTSGGGNAWDVTIDSAGNFYLGGSFSSYSGVTAGGIVKLSPNGDVDLTFNSSNGFSGGIVFKIITDFSDNIYVGGSFTSYSAVSANRIIKLLQNGEKDTSFDNSTGFNGSVNDITLDSLGKLYVVGAFTTYKGATNNRIIKLNTDGSKDATFSSVSTFSTNNAVSLNSIHIDSSGGIYIGGRFTTYSLFFVNSLIKVDSAGNRDSTFNSFGSVGPNATVNVIKTDSNGDLIVGGIFNTYKQPLGLASINSYDAKQNYGFNPNYGVNLSVSLNSITVQTIKKSPSNNLYVGGFFENYTLPNSNYRSIAIIGLNSDGTPNSGIDVNSGANSTIRKIFIDSVGGIYLTGAFTSYKGVSNPGFIKINSNASVDNTFTRSGLQSAVYGTADFDVSNNIYLGGNFTSFSSQTNNRIIKLFPTGFKDDSFDNSTGFNNDVSSLKIDNYGKIVAVGPFTTYKGVTANRIIRLNTDGSKDTTFDNSVGFNGVPYIVRVWGDKIYVVGTFTTYKGITCNGIIRLNYDGSIDNSFNPKNGFTSGFGTDYKEMLIDNKGNVYVCGFNIIYQGYNRNQIVKIKPDGSKDVLFFVPSTNLRRGNPANSFTTSIQEMIFL
jgi:uncharacterized delta-60 repeat protein